MQGDALGRDIDSIPLSVLYWRASVPAPLIVSRKKCTLDNSGAGTEARPYRVNS